MIGVQLIPELRFPEFEGVWIEKKLGEITIWASGGTPSKDNPLYWNGDIPWISASTMRGIEYSDSNIKITSEGLRNGSKLAPKGSLLILVRGSMLFNKIPIGIAKNDLAFNQDVKSININSGNNTKFILYWFISKEPIFLNLVSETGIGAGKLDLSDLKKKSIVIPTSHLEQQKIATFLTSVDKRITLLTQKKEKLEQYKKGVMQKIFNQEIRFKDENGGEFPEWVEKKLGDLSENIMYGLNSSAKEFNGIDKYIRITDIDDKSNKFIPSPLTSPDGTLTDSYLVNIGDILFTRTGASVGKSYIYKKADGKLFFAGFLIRFSITKANPDFVFYQTLSYNYKKWVRIMSMRSGQPGINAEEYKIFSFQTPCLAEQQKIATFLSALDKQIEKVGKQEEAMKEWKKGLLQKMFV